MTCKKCGFIGSIGSIVTYGKCPQCGWKESFSIKRFFIVLIIVIVLAFGMGFLIAPKQTYDPETLRKEAKKFIAESKEKNKSTEGLKYTNGGYIASISLENVKKASKYVTQGDKEAFDRMIITDQVFILKDNVPVYIDDTKLFSGLVKIRPKGQTTSVWTVIEAVN